MQIRIKEDSVEIDGYVNAVERKSKPLQTRLGSFVERIKKGAFKRALERNDDVKILLNHRWDRKLGGTKDGNLKLEEDNIGLKVRATITDAEVVEKARNGELVGWSFGFTDRDGGVVTRTDEDGLTLRDVSDLNLFEVSILDRQKNPAYNGTLVTVRSDDEIQLNGAPFFDAIETRDDSKPSLHQTLHQIYKSIIDDMKEDY